jgi:transposase
MESEGWELGVLVAAVGGPLPWRLEWLEPATPFQRWLQAGCFEAIVHDIRALLREKAGKEPLPTAAVLDSRTVRSTPENGSRAGYDGHKRVNGSKVHLAVDTLGHLLALLVTAADHQDPALVGALTEQVQDGTGQHVEIAYADQGYTGAAAEERRWRMGSNCMWSACGKQSKGSC